MIRLEGRYLDAAQKPVQAARLVLVDRLTGAGARDPGLPAAIRAELDALRPQLTQVAREHSQALGEVAGTLAETQFELLQRFDPGTPPFAGVEAASLAERQAVATGFIDNATGWVDVAQARLLAELARLRDEPESVIVERLFAEQVRDRASVWRHGMNLLAANTILDMWSTAVTTTGVYYATGQSQAGQQWRNQVIAAIDERTTDCCLQAHAQIQLLDEPFVLTGTPRFSDEKLHPPFHDFCRTSEALWLEHFEEVGPTTGEMRDAARAEIKARQETGRRVEIHPAHATSRRR
jgi:hypothetical protein